MRILLVEDSKRLQMAVSVGLRKSGYAVDVASDGEEGLWRAETCEYDAIVLDLMLPKLDGLSLLDQIAGWQRRTTALAQALEQPVPALLMDRVL